MERARNRCAESCNTQQHGPHNVCSMSFCPAHTKMQGEQHTAVRVGRLSCALRLASLTGVPPRRGMFGGGGGGMGGGMGRGALMGGGAGLLGGEHFKRMYRELLTGDSLSQLLISSVCTSCEHFCMCWAQGSCLARLLAPMEVVEVTTVEVSVNMDGGRAIMQHDCC